MTDRAEIGRQASIKGFANESRLLAALLERGFNASMVDLPLSTYDIVVELNRDDMIRVQVKTLKGNSVPFTGGGRAGVDRTYKSSVKEYTHSTKTCDVVVGVRSTRDNGDVNVNFYFVPTIYIEHIKQKSKAVGMIPFCKNNWSILERCKDRDFVIDKFKMKP